MRYNFKDITGQVIENFTVLGYSHTDKSQRGSTVWKVRCICGTEKLLLKSHLIAGRIKSCGCRQYLGGFKVDRNVYALNQIYNHYVQSAKKRNLKWDISKEECEVFLKNKCHYCGRKEISHFKQRGCDFRYNGIDRRVNFLGYTKENCVTCCIECNRAKNNHNTEYFDQYISDIVSNRLQVLGPVTEKVWGTETLMTNEDLYCSKFLKINPGFRCSLHKHFNKKETFSVLEGEVLLETKFNENAPIVIEKLKAGASRLIMPGTFHRFSSKCGAIMLETSTNHSDEDVYRLEDSGKVE